MIFSNVTISFSGYLTKQLIDNQLWLILKISVMWSCWLLCSNQITRSHCMHHSRTRETYLSFSHHVPLLHCLSDASFLLWCFCVWSLAQVEKTKRHTSRSIAQETSCLVSRAPEGEQAVTMQTIYFYIVKRNCASVSTFHRSEVKLPQHRKRPVIHPSCPPYTKTAQRINKLWSIDLHAIKCLCSACYRHRGFRLNRLNVEKAECKIAFSSHVLSVLYSAMQLVKFRMNSSCDIAVSRRWF